MSASLTSIYKLALLDCQAAVLSRAYQLWSGSLRLGIAERKGRQRAEREDRIVAAARVIAEREGWSAVTIRRLAEEIEYSQPVLYSHFENRDAIVAAVAVEGFREITKALQKAARDSSDRRAALENVAT